MTAFIYPEDSCVCYQVLEAQPCAARYQQARQPQNAEIQYVRMADTAATWRQRSDSTSAAVSILVRS